MYDIIFQHIDYVIHCANILLDGDCGKMNEKQTDFLQRIVTNAQNLGALCEEFEMASSQITFSWDDIAKVRHELANPITPLLAFSELMLMNKVGELSDEQSEGVNAIFTSAGNIRDLLKEIVEESQRLQSAHIA